MEKDGAGVYKSKKMDSIYNGMFSNDECTGCGVWENEKLRYDGYFKNGKRDGEGVEIFYPEKYNMKNPPLKFVGHFKEGERDGLGVKEFKNGLKYDGNFVKGKREGQGKLVWPKEDRNGEINIKVFLEISKMISRQKEKAH